MNGLATLSLLQVEIEILGAEEHDISSGPCSVSRCHKDFTERSAAQSRPAAFPFVLSSHAHEVCEVLRSNFKIHLQHIAAAARSPALDRAYLHDLTLSGDGDLQASWSCFD